MTTPQGADTAREGVQRYCIGCKHLTYAERDRGSQGSTLTGTYGDVDANLSCHKGYWALYFGYDYGNKLVGELELAMLHAATCPDYAERKQEAA